MKQIQDDGTSFTLEVLNATSQSLTLLSSDNQVRGEIIWRCTHTPFAYIFAKDQRIFFGGLLM